MAWVLLGYFASNLIFPCLRVYSGGTKFDHDSLQTLSSTAMSSEEIAKSSQGRLRGFSSHSICRARCRPRKHPAAARTPKGRNLGRKCRGSQGVCPLRPTYPHRLSRAGRTNRSGFRAHVRLYAQAPRPRARRQVGSDAARHIRRRRAPRPDRDRVIRHRAR